jgi:hypothetical protein
MRCKLSEKDWIEIMFVDGSNTATAIIPYSKIKELLMDDAYEIITKPNCNDSSCAINGFCECNPINEDMEFAGIFVCVECKEQKAQKID